MAKNDSPVSRGLAFSNAISFHDLDAHPRVSASLSSSQLIATAATFLACKVEESPRNLQDLAYVHYRQKNCKDPKALERLHRERVGAFIS